MGEAGPQRIALISIHPRHADAILDGTKHVELRRVPFASDTTHAILYATAPVSAVVGWFRVRSIEADTITGIWDRFGRVSGISRREHRAYFAGARQASAIRIAEAHRLLRSQPLVSIDGVQRPPQSYQYVDPEAAQRVLVAASVMAGAFGPQAQHERPDLGAAGVSPRVARSPRGHAETVTA
ncbi:hypothetical protein [Patulibacter sp.]|uniref:hypothetical protein n=1 Tax=Patulibacter sp. TaxID=1912859 RepID=UPI002715DA71|nr:hypothetical protein [Patulibacter sp.]MDO9408589.1 hypothetical protein [Patulibacter sp.]